jgi:hypothetical protein
MGASIIKDKNIKGPMCIVVCIDHCVSVCLIAGVAWCRLCVFVRCIRIYRTPTVGGCSDEIDIAPIWQRCFGVVRLSLRFPFFSGFSQSVASPSCCRSHRGAPKEAWSFRWLTDLSISIIAHVGCCLVKIIISNRVQPVFFIILCVPESKTCLSI